MLLEHQILCMNNSCFFRFGIVLGCVFFIQTTLHAQSGIQNQNSMEQTEIATFGAGCFWCVETIFQELKGVEEVISGYAGGDTENPTYKEICTGETGHAEVIQIHYQPSIISFAELLEVFWKVHNPTTLNRQGLDVGTQYRSVVFYHSDIQKQEAEKYKTKLDSAGAFPDPIVTEISPFEKFYPAEDYHQDYYSQNPFQGYCRVVIAPKLEKFRKVFKHRLKEK